MGTRDAHEGSQGCETPVRGQPSLLWVGRTKCKCYTLTHCSAFSFQSHGWPTVVGDTPKIYFSMFAPRRWPHVKLLRTRPLSRMQALGALLGCLSCVESMCLGRSTAGTKPGAYWRGEGEGRVTHPAGQVSEDPEVHPARLEVKPRASPT